jgi:hypothetical protein
MTIVEALRFCIEELERVGGNRGMVRDAKDSLKAFHASRRHASRVARGRNGRPTLGLPWDDIEAEVKRKTPWKEIRDRLEAAGYRISLGHLRRRYARRLAAAAK